jgi:hypothetical protein
VAAEGRSGWPTISFKFDHNNDRRRSKGGWRLQCACIFVGVETLSAFQTCFFLCWFGWLASFLFHPLIKKQEWATCMALM